MAAVAVTFARYAKEIVRTDLSERALSVLALAVLSAVNCFGVRFGSKVQSTLMVLKIGAIAVLLLAGFLASKTVIAGAEPIPIHGGIPLSFAAAMVPVLFAFGGWQTASFMTGEMRDPKRDLAQALLFGVVGVIAIYLGVNLVCLRVLGGDGLARTSTPAFTVMHLAIGSRGAVFMALAISISTLGFLSQGMLTAPRVYFAMARDGLFFRSIAWLPRRTRVPVAAIACKEFWQR